MLDQRAGSRPGTRRPRHPSQFWPERPFQCYMSVGPAPFAPLTLPSARVTTARWTQFRSYTGLVPKASETGDTDRKGRP
jgi:hypothetical protein